MEPNEAMVAVLAGGRGTRLGGAKACAALHGAPLISYPLVAAARAGLETVVVAKRDSALPELAVPVLIEPDRPVHPLCGAVRALEHVEAHAPGSGAIVMLACDMPFVSAELLRWLAGLEGPALAQVGGRAQPGLCRCETSHLPTLRMALASEDSMTRAISALAPRILDEHALARFGEPAQLCFNVNGGDDLASAERWLAERARAAPQEGASRARRSAAERS